MRKLRRMKVAIDCDPVFNSYDLGDLGSWDSPGFTKRQALSLLRKQKGLIWEFDKKREIFIIEDHGDSEASVIRSRVYQTVDGKKKLFAIGENWCWREVERNDA